MPRGRKDIAKDGVKFSKDYQPSTEAKLRGRTRSYTLKAIAESVVSGKMADIGEKLKTQFGLTEDVTVEVLAHLRQIEKAIKSGDTQAYNAFMDRFKGKPKQAVDVTSGGEAINVIPIMTVTINESNGKDK